MKNFQLKNPTKIIFGKDQLSKMAAEIPKDSKVLMLYGGGSIKKNGIYDNVKAAMEGFEIEEFGGIPANPEYDILLQALKVIKEKDITFLLSVGGGSVIDGTKFLSAAALFEGDEPWDILTKSKRTMTGMPFGTVLTLPATGSEMNSGAVITRKETKEKRTMGGPGLFPEFSVLDPEVIKSIPKRQLANGLADSFTHVTEQYLTYPVGALLQDRFAESILQTLVDIAPKIMEEDFNYEAASNFMWCCTMALNGLINKGVPSDWATHMMGHELTALYGIDHARTLAIIAGNHYTHNFDDKKEKLAQYAERVWDVREGTTEEKARIGITKTTEFYQSLGIDTKLSAYTESYDGTAEIISKRFEERGWMKLGERQNVSPSDVEEIVKMSY